MGLYIKPAGASQNKLLFISLVPFRTKVISGSQWFSTANLQVASFAAVPISQVSSRVIFSLLPSNESFFSSVLFDCRCNIIAFSISVISRYLSGLLSVFALLTLTWFLEVCFSVSNSKACANASFKVLFRPRCNACRVFWSHRPSTKVYTASCSMKTIVADR